MWESIAQLDRSSAGAVGTLVAFRQFGRQSPVSLESAAAEAYPRLKSAPEPYREKIEPEFLAYVEELNQWNLPGETVSANVGMPLFTTHFLVAGSVVGDLRQPYLHHDFAWWGALPSPGIFGRRLDWPFVGVFGQERLYRLPYHLCPVKEVVSTSHLPGINLVDLYHIEDSEAVAEFLARNAFLNDLLVEAHGKIVEFFGEGAEVYLEVYEDPDFGGDRKLYAVIVTPLAAKDAIPLQEQFDDAWWLNNLMRARGKLNIIVEYV